MQHFMFKESPFGKCHFEIRHEGKLAYFVEIVVPIRDKNVQPKTRSTRDNTL